MGCDASAVERLQAIGVNEKISTSDEPIQQSGLAASAQKR
jgi:hypothetical protein